MRLIVALPVFVALLDVASAALHNAGICVDWTNDAAVYNKDATAKACDAYKRRNTGDKQWDKCPDCGLKDITGLVVCSSDGWHIGGDELDYYCKQNGAQGSYATKS